MFFFFFKRFRHTIFDTYINATLNNYLIILAVFMNSYYLEYLHFNLLKNIFSTYNRYTKMLYNK